MNLRPVMRYHGGKHRMAGKIVQALPPHRIYVEPFGGAASVLIRKERSYAEIYNDRWGFIVALFRVLRDPAKAAELERQLRLTPFAREEFEQTGIDHLEGLGDIEFARRLIFRSYAGFGSAGANPRYKTGFRTSCTRTGTTPAHDWQNYPASIRLFADRLQGVVIENRPAIDVMRQHDGREALHYVDPPYVHSTRSRRNTHCNKKYEFELSDDDHRELAGVLRGLEGMVVLSGYRSELYDELFGDWRKIEMHALADGARKRIEVLWFNPRAWDARRLPLEAA